MNNSSTHYDSISYKSQTNSKRKYKIILLGDSGTGKTSIISRFINGKFEPNEDPTIGIDFLVKNMTYQGTTIRIQLWDTAGQQKFKSLIPSYLKDATAAIFVFDFQRPQTLKNLQDWISMFRDNNSHQNGTKSMIGMLCGNKSDLQKQKLDKQKLYELMDRYKFPYQSVSAKSGNNIEQLFYLILQTVVSKQKQEQTKKRKNIEKIKQNGIQGEGHTDRGNTQRDLESSTRLNKTNQKQSPENQSKNKKNIQLNKNSQTIQNKKICEC